MTDPTETPPPPNAPVWPALTTVIGLLLTFIIWAYLAASGRPVSWDADSDVAFFTLILALCAVAGTGLSSFGVYLLSRTLKATQETLTAAEETVRLTRDFNIEQSRIGRAQTAPILTVDACRIIIKGPTPQLQGPLLRDQRYPTPAFHCTITGMIENLAQHPAERCHITASTGIFEPQDTAKTVFENRKPPSIDRLGTLNGGNGVGFCLDLELTEQPVTILCKNAGPTSLLPIRLKTSCTDLFDVTVEREFFLRRSAPKTFDNLPGFPLEIAVSKTNLGGVSSQETA